MPLEEGPLKVTFHGPLGFVHGGIFMVSDKTSGNSGSSKVSIASFFGVGTCDTSISRLWKEFGLSASRGETVPSSLNSGLGDSGATSVILASFNCVLYMLLGMCHI